jgi:hypothetical protein
MLCVLIPAGPLYLGLVWLLSRLLCRNVAHRKAHVAAAAIALGVAALIASLGVPYVPNAQDRVGAPLAMGLLALGPILFPRLGRRTRIGVVIAAVLAFTEPVVRVEYLTWRDGQALRAALLREHPDAGLERIFSVFSRSQERAAVLRVECNDTAYIVDFETDAKGLWRVASASYPPQQLLWYHGNSGWYDYPYPTAVLLITHRSAASCRQQDAGHVGTGR